MRTLLLSLLALFALGAAACTAGQSASAETIEAVAQVDEPGSVDQALAAVSAYFAAFNDGDADAIAALLAEDAEFSDSFTGSITREAWEQRLAWNLAQGTTLASPDCKVSEDGGSAGTAVRCESATSNAQIRAVGARAVPTSVHFSVSPQGIGQVAEEYGQPDFLQAVSPFMEWMEATHPDAVANLGFNAWTSVDEATANGELTKEYAHLWAGYLETNCVRIPGLVDPARDTYLDDC